MFEMLAACVKSYVFYVKPKFVNLYAQSSEIGLHLVCVSRCCEYIGDDVMFAVYGSAVKTEEAFRFTFKSSSLQRWSAHLRQNGMTTTCK